MSYRVYSARGYPREYRDYRPRTDYRPRYSRREFQHEYRRARVEKNALEFEKYFGGTRGRPYYSESKAIYSSTMVYTSQYKFDEDERIQMPIMFTQFVLKPYDTTLFTSGDIKSWDRFRVVKIRLEYIPTGTEAIIASLIVNTRGTYPDAPYANVPIYFGYDPTANIANMSQAIEGSKRFEYPTVSNPPTTEQERDIEAKKKRYRTAASEAMKLSQIEVGCTTEKYKSEVVDPRCMQFSLNGPTSSSVQNSVLDVSTQMQPSMTTAEEMEGKLIATYGTFNIAVPNVILGTGTPTVRVNVVATFTFELYGDR